MLDFLLCFPLFFAFLHFMVIPPPSKRRRRGRSEQHQDVLPAGATETDTELLDRAGGFFTQANLDAPWVNRSNGADAAWRERIPQAVTHWKMMQQLQPSATITRNKFLKTKNSFGRTHAAVKKGVMAVIVFKCIFGSHAYFDFDNADGGLLKGCSSLALYDSHIVPLVSFLCHFFNAVDHRSGDLLAPMEVLNCKIGNWFKNLFKRSSENGTHSDDGVFNVLADNAAGRHAGETCCYIHWHKWVAQNFPHFHAESQKKRPTHVITDAENTGTNWTAIRSDNAYVFEQCPRHSTVSLTSSLCH